VADATIRAEQLVREFKKGPRAVDGIDLAVSAGEIFGFLGPNGAGKSTTVHMLTTLLPPTSGTARVAGFDVVREGPQVRRHIGAALQEAALDPLLTGREHVRLQASLQGLPRSERKQRADEVLGRVGLRDAGDRRVRGYSGGMKRRLDLALALVHRPQILFLDEPTTGLDVQSRTALWGEVSRLARDDGVTVFLTTQYLEEADVLADRVGIIDHGRIVAEGTPASLKAEVGRPTIEVIPAEEADVSRAATILARFGEPVAGRRLPCEDRSLAGGRRRRRGRGRQPRDGARLNGALDQVYLLGRRSVVRTLRQPANIIGPLVFPMLLLAVNSGGLEAETHLPGFPTDSFVAFALAVPFIQGALFATMNAGTDLARDIQTGFLSRLSLTPMRGVTLLAGQLGGVVVLGLVQATVYLTVGLAVGVRLESGIPGVVVLFAFAFLVSLGFGALGAFAALRTGSGEAVQSLFPVFFVFLFISSMNIPRNLIEVAWFRDLATANPVSYLLECVRSLIITGWDKEALALGFGIGALITLMALAASTWALRERMARS
jgi:ABC-2 type transport system ATP-binding protein